MPRIKKETYQYLGEITSFEIWFNTRKGFYVKNLPEEIKRICPYLMETTYMEYDTFENCLANAIVEVNDFMTKSDDVFLVNLIIPLKMYTELTEQFNNGGVYILPDHPLSKFVTSSSTSMYGFGFLFDYTIAKKFTLPNGKPEYFTFGTKSRHSQSGRITKDKNQIEIPFNKENQDFLEYIKYGVANLVNKFSEMFESETKFLEAKNNIELFNIKQLSE